MAVRWMFPVVLSCLVCVGAVSRVRSASRGIQALPPFIRDKRRSSLLVLKAPSPHSILAKRIQAKGDIYYPTEWNISQRKLGGKSCREM
ncbi:hypothetical protein FN846DRAFT_972350 [Sphaerosporella brunnea]|uniref:Uncharacterized protein n=1 Tax=Sphaerosporella brunnea TaxID=1250544 RepID=A0A5J5EI17_9PEZI|nr:hypothetical protein FN846DRAFT_972350 [Sphaerosporella brunnea]